MFSVFLMWMGGAGMGAGIGEEREAKTGAGLRHIWGKMVKALPASHHHGDDT